MPTFRAVPRASREVRLRVKSPLAGSAAEVVWVVGETVYSKYPRPPGSVEVSRTVPTGSEPIAMDGLLTHWMSLSSVARKRVTSVRGNGPAFRTLMVIRHFSPLSQKRSPSPLMSCTMADSTMMFGSATRPQLASRANEMASSGMPLLSPSTMKGESQASPTPSLS